jgi:hypothetical protein
MIRVFLIAMVVVIAACGARSPNATTATNAKAQTLKWEGESCIHSSECFSLWCANGECVRREP